MDIERARYLVSHEGRAQLAEAREMNLPTHDLVDLSTRLRRAYAPEVAAALGEQLVLGRGFDRDWLLTAPGLEMMTDRRVAERRAARLVGHDGPIVDLTCGLGGDLSAMVTAGITARGVDSDEATALLAASNVPGVPVVHGDASTFVGLVPSAGLMLDPARRDGQARAFNPAAFAPPWDLCMAWAQKAPLACVKGPPGLDHRHIPSAAEAEWVQAGRSLRECTLWFGGAAQPGLKRATLIGESGTTELTSRAPECPAAPVPAGSFVFDPQSCVTRAGVVRQLGHILGARLIDPRVAYLTGETLAGHALSEAFVTLEVVPFGVRRLQGVLRARGWRPTEVRRRAFPVQPEELLRLLGPIVGSAVTLLCTTVAGKRLVLVCQPA